jgi:hypothetical protein
MSIRLAVSIADIWQHAEPAGLLLQQLIAYAKQSGIRGVHTVELYDNRRMHDFAVELGICAKRDSGDATQSIYSMSI